MEDDESKLIQKEKNFKPQKITILAKLWNDNILIRLLIDSPVCKILIHKLF